MTEPVLIDGHVHIYPDFDLSTFLDAASRNFPGRRGCLLLTETARDHAFAALRDAQGLPAGWQVQTFADDPAALCLRGKDAVLWVIAGYQLVSAEGIEVLTVCTTDRWPDGLTLDEIMARLAEAGRPAILPWGVGKWIGRRGQILADLLDRGVPPGVHLGDNAGRPGFWHEPPLFARARAAGLAVLPGSDPLPVPGGDRDPGRFGFTLSGAISDSAPAQDIAARLVGLTAQPAMFGTRTGSLSFLRQQIQLRMK
ncbi:hypothetical protein [Actibacterium ureilyticum]|uniref:hypothetical protein n=1 Tax=Actibacterium ureilyticum TaxID=1590614 RepID=UPI000BAADABC|nr:hypothetical protein [Actibacterium ureilyticum]